VSLRSVIRLKNCEKDIKKTKFISHKKYAFLIFFVFKKC
jgi:hypothetical protein